ncbi:hypothetical protein PPSIR1_00932 [Plesiocystis pacifica SIR-1]|uniref:Lipoprotein n=1 Tax=Plesiocystis pacifica SIR-1 TaxID=391625 RepID=A6GCC0_9BACT|nr:hypothetical protein [Plesiocystis pacifica]EDM76479.1 hypothetical protein PPSIR1_00932 [Plesiocystis pacifica SIR-1]
MLRTSKLLLSSAACLALSFTVACDKPAEGGDKAEAGDKADADKADADKAEADKAEADKADEPKKLEWTWKTSDVSGAMKAGTTLTYKQTGKDAKGKEVEDDYECQVKSATGTAVGTVCNGVNHPSEDKGANEVATRDFNQYSPFFTTERTEVSLVERAELTVAAGTFDTVQAELEGFMGGHYTVWMIADKPGVYAKVHKHANVNDESDQTDMVFELASM